jgi:hypothetical protein
VGVPREFWTIMVPFGKRLQKTMENHHAINGKIDDLYGHFQ